MRGVDIYNVTFIISQHFDVVASDTDCGLLAVKPGLRGLCASSWTCRTRQQPDVPNTSLFGTSLMFNYQHTHVSLSHVK